MKITIISTVVTTLMLFIMMGILLHYTLKKQDEKIDRIFMYVCQIGYTFFIFVAISLYILILMCFPNINAFWSALILVGIIRIVSKYMSKCIDIDFITSKERQISVLISVFEISLILGVLSCVYGEREYLKYILVALSIIIGFFVSLKNIVENNTFKEMLIEIVKDIIPSLEYLKKAIIITVVLTVGMGIIYIIITFVPKNIQTGIQKGMGIGTIAYIMIFLFCIYIDSKYNIINKFFIKRNVNEVKCDKVYEVTIQDLDKLDGEIQYMILKIRNTRLHNR